MNILHIETSTIVCSAAWSKNGELQKQLINLTDGQHAKQLPLFIDELLNDIHSQSLNLDAVSIGSGPGSYTGLRIATATAKGLCYVMQIPLIAIDTLQVLVENVKEKQNFCNQLPTDTLLCPMIDARRMEVYCALYDAQGQRLTDVEAKVITNDSFSDYLSKGKVLFFGDGASKCKMVLTHPNAVFVEGIVPEARYMATLAKEKYEKAETENTAYYNPFYLKEYQAIKSKNKVL